VEHLDLGYAAAKDQGSQIALDGLDFRELGHARLLAGRNFPSNAATWLAIAMPTGPGYNG
jgi:hypothetical protein